MTNGKTIYHVCFGDDLNFYFGSISAIFDRFTPQELGVLKSSLWNYNITETKPFRNKHCIIYKGTIHRKKTNRALPK